MKIERKWAMPNASTFHIKPIGQWVESHLCDGVWVDPFVGRSPFKSRMTHTNDLNPTIEATHHMDALEFMESLPAQSVDGLLYDPPYSPRQVSEVYQGFGMAVTSQMTSASFWAKHKDAIARLVKPGGIVLTFGWNSGGIGKGRGFEIESILLVPHGSWKHDTICVQERRK